MIETLTQNMIDTSKRKIIMRIYLYLHGHQQYEL